MKMKKLEKETYEYYTHTMPQQKELLLLRAQYNKLSLFIYLICSAYMAVDLNFANRLNYCFVNH